MSIQRIYQDLTPYLAPGKALIIYGPRQAGKTTLLENFLATATMKYKLASGDNLETQHMLSTQDISTLQDYTAGYQLLAIDEAQKIANIGINLKIMLDHIPNLIIIATGSSSFELAGQIGEPLTGRKKTLTLYPVAQLELSKMHNLHEMRNNLEQTLIFGSYPEIVTANNKAEKIELISEITQSYLLKDILSFEKVKNSRVLFNLLRLLAYQIGSEVSLNELAKKLAIDTKTVARYIDLLEKAFVIISLGGFSRNLRKEVVKKQKYYFYDNGIRNTIISNFNSLEVRNDIGQLWENFLFIERLKKRSYTNIHANQYFWRTWDQKEIDLIEEREGKLFGYEFKWAKNRIKIPQEWLDTYKNSEFHIINQDNYLEFIT